MLPLVPATPVQVPRTFTTRGQLLNLEEFARVESLHKPRMSNRSIPRHQCLSSLRATLLASKLGWWHQVSKADPQYSAGGRTHKEPQFSALVSSSMHPLHQGSRSRAIMCRKMALQGAGGLHACPIHDRLVSTDAWWAASCGCSKRFFSALEAAARSTVLKSNSPPRHSRVNFS